MEMEYRKDTRFTPEDSHLALDFVRPEYVANISFARRLRAVLVTPFVNLPQGLTAAALLAEVGGLMYLQPGLQGLIFGSVTVTATYIFWPFKQNNSDSSIREAQSKGHFFAHINDSRSLLSVLEDAYITGRVQNEDEWNWKSVPVKEDINKEYDYAFKNRFNNPIGYENSKLKAEVRRLLPEALNDIRGRRSSKLR